MKTKHKNSNKESRKSDLFTQKILDSIPGNVVIIDEEGKIAESNQSWNKLAVDNGADPENSWIGEDYLEVFKKINGFSNETAQEASRGIDSIQSGKEPSFVLEYTNQSSKEERWFSMQATGFDYEDNKWVSMVLKDITASKEQDISRPQNEQNFLNLVEQSPISIQIHTSNGKLYQSNEAYQKLFALSKKSLADLYEYYNVLEDEQAVKLGIMPYVKKTFAGEVVYFPEYEYDGIDTIKTWDPEHPVTKRCWLRTKGFPIKDNAGKVTHAVFMSEDITEWKQAEIALKDERLFAENLVQSANVMIIGLDKDGKVNLFNPAAEKITGYKLGDLTNKDWFQILVPIKEYPHVHEEFNRLMKGGMPQTFQNPILTKDGEERIISWSNNRITDGDHIRGILSFGVDITEQEISLRALKQSEERYRALFSGSQNGIIFADVETRKFKYANPAAAKMFGYTQEELCQLGVEDIHPSDALEMVFEEFEAQLKGERNFASALPCLTKEDKILYANVSASKLSTSEGDFSVGFFTDVTVQKEAEKALLENEAKFRNLMEQSPLAILISWPDGSISQTNEAFRKLWGLTKEEISELRKKYNTLQDKQLKKMGVMPFIEKAYKGEEVFLPEILYDSQETLEHLGFKDPSGNKHWVKMNMYPIKDHNNQIMNIVHIEEDITDRKKSEEALTESEEKFRLLIEQSPYSIQIFKPNGRTDQVNEAFKKLWGIKEDELKDVIDNYNVLEDEEANRLGLSSAIREVFKGGEPIILPMIEYDAARTMNEFGVEIGANKKWVQAKLYPVKNSKGEVVNVVDMEEDMTEVKQKELEIMNYQQRLKALTTELTISEEKQRRAIATDLHDHVGQMLASSRLQIAALTDKLEKQEILEKLENISQGLMQGIQATRNAIFELSPPQLNEIGLVAAISDWVDEELETKHKINVNLTGDNKVFLIEDNVRILTFRCIRELLMNVVKHAKATQVDLDIKESKGNLAICLNDNGIGFNYSPALLRIKGSGFGLFSIQERIENIGGKMEIKSEKGKGKGTKVKLSVPLKY